MNTKDEILDAIERRHSGPLPPPVLLTQTGTVGLMEGCGTFWPEAHYDTAKMVRLALQPSERFGFATARVPFDLTAEAEALGCTVSEGTRDSQPMVTGSPWRDLGTIPPLPDLISPGEMLSSHRIRTVLEAAERIHDVRGDLFLTTMCLSPEGIASHMLGMETMIMGTMMDPDGVKGWVEAVSGHSRAYASALSEVSDNVVMISSIQSDLLMPETNAMIADIARGTISSIGQSYSTVHNCGNTLRSVDDIVGMRPDIVSLETSSDPEAYLRAIGGRCVTLGCINPVRTLLQGSADDVRGCALESAELGFDLVGPECGVPPLTPDANLRALAVYRDRFTRCRR